MHRIRITNIVPAPLLTPVPRSAHRRGLPIAVGSVGLALLGSACIGSSDGGAADSGELGQVSEVVISEEIGDDGVTETITLSVGAPATLQMNTIDSGVDLVSPTELEPSDSCLVRAAPEPVEDSFRGIGEQDGVELAYFVTRYADEDAAHDAMSASTLCYLDYAAELSSQRGFELSESRHEDLQFFDRRDGEPYEFRIQTDVFGDPGPAVYSARLDDTVATVIDLDNQLDEFDAESLSVQIAELGA